MHAVGKSLNNSFFWPQTLMVRERQRQRRNTVCSLHVMTMSRDICNNYTKLEIVFPDVTFVVGWALRIKQAIYLEID